MIVRRYRKSDFDALTSLYREFFNEIREQQGMQQLKLNQTEAKEIAKESLDPNSTIFVAEEDGKLVGFARVQLWDGAYFGREIFIAKPFRRKGLGSRLLASCEDHVQDRGETSIYLTVEPKNSVSISFLMQNGYDTLNMLELRKDLAESGFPERKGEVEMLGHRLRLLKRTQDYQHRWIDGEEDAQSLDLENQIYPNIEPTIAYNSPENDSPPQARLRRELKHSGLKICYQSRRDGNSELYVMDADGTNRVNVTKTPTIDETYPHVSSDGKRLCFTVVRGENTRDGRAVPRFNIYWMNMTGSKRTLVEKDATDPCWNPAGTRIVYVERLGTEKPRDFQNKSLYVHDIHTRKTEELTGGKLYHAYVPCWSPADDWIVMTAHKFAELDHAILALNLKSRRLYSLKQSGIDGCRPDISWSGKLICWNPNDIQVGAAQFRPASTCRLPLRVVAQAPAPNGTVYFGDWSPDGKYLAYAMNPNFKAVDTRQGAPWDIFVTKAQGGPYVQLTFDHANNKHPEFFCPP